MDLYEKLLDLMSRRGSVIVAYSGGVDSSLVALAAKEALGEGALAVMFDNETITRAEVDDAVRTAEELGIALRIEKIKVLDIVEVVENPIDRCGACKHHLMSFLKELSDSLNFDHVADGANSDDPDDHRPGLASSDRLGIWHPLMEAGIGKSEARSILKEKGISVHDKPSTTCLMTRIPYGERITIEKIGLIENMERRIATMGFRDIRLRLFEREGGGYIGILEVDDPEKAFRNWNSIDQGPEEVKLVLDPKGYRQGSMNKGLVPPQGL